MYDLRAKQAQQQIGDILQQATGADGVVDHQRAQALAAQAGPGVQVGMQSFLTSNSALRGSQIVQGAALHSLSGNLAASVMNNATDDNMAKIRASAVASGLPPSALAEIDRIAALPEAQRGAEAYKHVVGNIDALGQLARGGYPTPKLENVGGQLVAPTIMPPSPYSPGRVSVVPGSVETTLSPAEAMNMGITYPATSDDVAAGRASRVGEDVRVPGPDVIKRFGYGGMLPPGARVNAPQPGAGGGPGVVNQDGTPVTVKPPRLLVVPSAPAPTPAPTAPQPVPPIPPANPPPVVSGPGPSGPTPPTVSGPGPSGPRVPTSSLLGGGVQTASTNALEAPVLGPAAPPSPLVPGDVAAIQAGMQGARDNRLPGTQVAGASFSTGAGTDEQVTRKLSQDRLLADSTIQSEYAKNILPYTQSLHLYGRGMTTAPGADFLNDMKGRAGGVLRSMGIATPFDSTKQYDELHKWLTQLVTSTPGAAGSDQRLATTLAGNANTGIHELAGEDMVKVGAALMRMNASVRSNWDDMGPAGQAKYGGYYSNYLRDVNKTLDLRGFAWDMLNPEQRKSLAEDLAAHRNDPNYAQNIINSREMARKAGYLGPQRAMP
jgi:hypothetical protein